MDAKCVAEFDKGFTRCYSCKKDRNCTYLKTAHVPLYGWVCEECREEWVLG